MLNKFAYTDIPEAKGAPWFRLEDWHEYHLICQGPRLTLKVDGRLAAAVTDNDPSQRDLSGILVLQLHTGPSTTAQFKDIQLNVLKSGELSTAVPALAPSVPPLRDKTLVVWAAPANLTQNGLVSGMFSGNCFLNQEGRPTMCHHQVGQGNAMAVAVDDDLNEWKKLESNPIAPTTKPGDPQHGQYRSWDPYGWLEGDTYYAIFGGERPGIAKAPSLAGEWKYVGDLKANTGEGDSITEDVSCADRFKIGDRHMLLCISHRLGCRYYLGDWKGEPFHPTFHVKNGRQAVMRRIYPSRKDSVGVALFSNGGPASVTTLEA